MRVALVVYASTRRSLECLLGCLFTLDCLYLQTHRDVPRIYESGVCYAREPRNGPGAEVHEERWASIPHALLLGWGDCDDLATWRAAELVERDGIAARPELVEVGQGYWHVIVRLPDGSTEDPSARLGMLRGSRPVEV